MAGFAEDYVDVAERLRLLREKHPGGGMRGSYELVEVNGTTHVVYRAECYRSADDPIPGVGFAWEQVPGKTPFTRGSELMNAETSAWGRAIVAVLAADTKRVASADEMRRTDVEYATTGEKNAIVAALKSLDTELRARVKDELRELFGKPQDLLASDVDAVLEHIEGARADAAPFSGGSSMSGGREADEHGGPPELPDEDDREKEVVVQGDLL